MLKLTVFELPVKFIVAVTVSQPDDELPLSHKNVTVLLLPLASKLPV
jgi:hypothetical protein